MRSLRTQLLLTLLAFMVLPWAGYRYVNDLESFLRIGEERALQGTAAILAASVADRMSQRSKRTGASQAQEAFFAGLLPRAPLLDGYAEDWPDSIPKIKALPFEYRIGVFEDYLYIHLSIKDRQRQYSGPDNTSPGDAVILQFQDAFGELREYPIQPTAPGWITARDKSGWPEPGIRGEWSDGVNGHNIELRIQKRLLAENMNILFRDASENGLTINPLMLQSTLVTQASVAPLIMADPALERQLDSTIAASEDLEVWLIDEQGWTAAYRPRYQDEDYRLKQNDGSIWTGLLSLASGSFLLRPNTIISNLGDGRFRQSVVVLEDMTNKPQGESWRQVDDDNLLLTVVAAIPGNHSKKSWVVLQKTNAGILLQQNEALLQLINISLAAFFIGGVLIAGFATLLVKRIRRLKNQFDHAVTGNGQINTQYRIRESSDELGDLARGFNAVLARLGQYHQYLEKLSGRLAHELRTPVTVVRSSLENIEQESDPEQKTIYLERAREGVERLSVILTSMSEASRLEQAIEVLEKEKVDLNALLSGVTQGYQIAWPQQQFELKTADGKADAGIAPELLVQALDKLVSNAVDFCLEGGAVTLSLRSYDKGWLISVANPGPTLPTSKATDLFQSMVSHRAGKDDRPHLGLGLYIVRLVADAHDGYATAANHRDGSGVTLSIYIPSAL